MELEFLTLKEIAKLPDRSLTLERVKAIGSSSEGWEALYPKLNDEALIYAVEQNLKNCQEKIRSTYDYMLKKVLVPLLLERFRE